MTSMFTGNDSSSPLLANPAVRSLSDDHETAQGNMFGDARPILSRNERAEIEAEKMAIQYDETATNAVSESAKTTGLFVLFLVYFNSNAAYACNCFALAVWVSLMSALWSYNILYRVYRGIGMLKKREILQPHKQSVVAGSGGMLLMESVCVALICFTGIGYAGMMLF